METRFSQLNEDVQYKYCFKWFTVASNFSTKVFSLYLFKYQISKHVLYSTKIQNALWDQIAELIP